jgi:ketosteroid isomerase-like protein
MKTCLSLVWLAVSFALPIFGQKKEEANFFLYRAIPANPQLAQQLEPINSQIDEAFNKHDAVAIAALFTSNATLIAPPGTFFGRDGIAKYFTDVFQRFNPSDQFTKLSYVYAFADDLCGIGGRSVTINGPRQGGGYLIRVYTRVGATWKIRLEVDKYPSTP